MLKPKKMVSFVTCCVFLFAGLVEARTIFVAGDSTAAHYDEIDHQGWAALLPGYINSSVSTVDNRASSGIKRFKASRYFQGFI